MPSPGGEIDELDLSDQFVAPSSSLPTQESTQPSAYMSAAVADEPQVETFEPQENNSPKIAVDPMMAEGPAAGSSGVSFSEMTELPPLKEVYVAPPPPPPVEVAPVKTQFAAPTTYRGRGGKDEKPKIEAREVRSWASHLSHRDRDRSCELRRVLTGATPPEAEVVERRIPPSAVAAPSSQRNYSAAARRRTFGHHGINRDLWRIVLLRLERFDLRFVGHRRRHVSRRFG